MPKKLWISVADPRRGGRARRLCWYAGTSDAVVAQAARLILSLPVSDEVLLLRDADGDVVPLSAALPSGASFALVLPERLRDRRLSNGTGEVLNVSDTEEGVGGGTEDEEEEPVEEMEDDEDESPPVAKRRRTSLGVTGDASASTVVAPADAAAATPPRVPEAAAQEPAALSIPPPAPLPILPAALTVRRPARSVANVVTHFLDAFTQAIANDDNVNFIPNTGRFALYALYSELVADRAYHPKHQDAFYKMTSMQGKVDRQRVNRYYLHVHAPSALFSTTTTTPSTSTAPSGRVEAVQYKPQGKGPLLRKYRCTSGEPGSDLVERAGVMASVLNLSPALVVDKYLAFVRGFQPVSKAEFLAHR